MTVKPLSRSLCVLGGTGFVGQQLVNHLIRDGYRVRVPTRRPTLHRDLLVYPGLDLIRADVHNEESLLHLLDGCEAAINLVGILNEPGHDGTGFRQVHVELTDKLLKACQETGVARLIQLSALKANAERGPSHYLRTKGEAEELIKRQSGDGIAYTLFRPSTIFGPDDSFTTRFAHLLKRLPVLPLPRPSARMAPVFVDDVARAIMAALHERSTHNQSYALCGPEELTLVEVVRYIRQLLGLHRAIVPLATPLGRLQARVGDWLPGKPFSLDNFRTLGVASTCATNGFARLGIEPTRLETQAPHYLVPDATRPTLPRSRRGLHSS